MPSDVRDTGIRTSTCRDGVDDFTGLGVEDIKTVAATAGLVAGTADVSAVETPAEAANRTAEVAEQGTLAEKVVGVPEGDQRVTTANCEVAAARSEFDAEASGGVGFDGVVDVEGRVGHVSHATVARSRVEMDIGGLRGAHVVGEGSGVGLDVLRAAFESFVGGGGIFSFGGDRGSLRGHIWSGRELDIDRDQSIVLVEVVLVLKLFRGGSN